MNRETLQVALDALRANKVRSALTMLGVIIGSACIVLVVTVALTGKRYIVGTIEGVGANLVYAQLLRAGAQQSQTLADELTLADMEAVRSGIPQVVAVAGTRELPATVVVEGNERAVALVGVTEQFQQIRNLVILRGRYFDADDMAMRSKVCLITDELARRLFPSEDAVGKYVRLGELQFFIIGVFRERVATFGQSEIKPESVVIPFPLIRNYSDFFVRTLYAQAARSEDVPAVTQQVRQILESRHRPGATYDVRNLSSILDAAQRIAQALTIVLLLVAFIALVISGIGIMNIMLVTVAQRTKEIGIRKAIGARRREILAQFLLEAGIISGVGGIIGILLALSVPLAINALLPLVMESATPGMEIPISWISIVVALAVSCLTGVLFGYLPANRAARLQPTESLRYE